MQTNLTSWLYNEKTHMTSDSSTQTPPPLPDGIGQSVKATIERWIKPKISKRRDAAHVPDLLGKFEEYLERSYTKQSYLSVLVFKNQQRLLEELYIPLEVISAKDSTKIKIDDYHDYFIPKYQKVLITDTAGMGKSTILRYLFISCLKANKGMPVFVELRKLNKDITILDYLSGEIGESKEFLEKLFKQGDFIFFLDGYDEIQYEQREQITLAIQDFISKSGKNFFALTSRPEFSLVSFPDFQEFKIKSLELDEAFALLKKYDSGGDLSDKIIAAINSGKNENVKEFLTNPLLVSLLYKSYEFKQKIPFKKHIFYRQVYDALFESHDLSKEGAPTRTKKSGLDIDDFHRVLRSLGYITVNLGKVEYGKDEILQQLSKAKERSPGLDFKTGQLLDDLVTTVPLFVLSGESYKWAHKAIQEYFAAQYICVDAKDKQAPILRAMYSNEENERYINVLDLCYDIDYKTFRHTIIYQLASEFVKHYDTGYGGFGDRQVDANEIHQRKILTFGYLFLLEPKFEQKPGLLSRFFNFSEDFQRLIKLDASLKNDRKVPREYKLTFANFWTWGRHVGPVVQYKNHVPPILNLLQSKNENVFSESPKLQAGRKEEPQGEQGAKGPKLDLTELTIVNDDPGSRINTDSNFGTVNYLIQVFDGRHTFMDITKSRTLKEAIENELAKENEDNLLLGQA